MLWIVTISDNRMLQMFLPCYHKPWIAWEILLVMSSVTGNLCNKCPKRLVKQNSSYSDYFNAISGFTLNSRAPGGPVTFIMVVCENFLLTIKSEFSVQGTIKIFLMDNYRKTIYGPVRIEFSSYRVFCVELISSIWSCGVDHRHTWDSNAFTDKGQQVLLTFLLPID